MQLKIDILLSTFNGAKYLREQLDSVLKQTYPHWRIIIRDDGSKDNTINIINDYLKLHPEKIELITDEFGNIGACQSYAKLIGFSDADYIMFADQDDVWLQDKISISMGKMTEYENKNSKLIPVLIHTDLKVVDNRLSCINESFMNYQGLNGNRVHLNQLILQNCVTGCTVLINKSLKDIISPINNNTRMHDWWIAIIASIFGEIIYIDQVTICYRQHSLNTIGAKKKHNIIMTLLKPFKLNKVKKDLYLAIYQAKSILENKKNGLSDYQKKILNGLSQFEEFSFLKKRVFLIKYSLFKYGFRGNIGLFILI